MKLEVSCRKLRCQPTKEASIQAANAWMDAQLEEYYAVCKSSRQRALATIVQANQILTHPTHRETVVKEMMPMLDLPEANRKLIAFALAHQQDYMIMHGEPLTLPVPPVEAIPVVTVHAGISEYIRQLATRLDIKNISAQTYENYTQWIKTFEEFHGVDKAISSINEKTVEEYHSFLAKSKWRNATRQLRWDTWKAAITKWVKSGYLIRPSNLDDKDWRFGEDDVVKDLWSMELFRSEYERAEPLARLILLLAANIGAYGSDMVNLKYDDGETITRCRTKTKKRKTFVKYYLWQETQQYLKSHGNLLRGMWKKEMVNGKLKKDDAIGRYARRFEKSIKWLRHTSAQKLEESERFRQYKDYFLAHSASKISEINYTDAVTPKQVFDYLHACYFTK